MKSSVLTPSSSSVHHGRQLQVDSLSLRRRAKALRFAAAGKGAMGRRSARHNLATARSGRPRPHQPSKRPSDHQGRPRLRMGGRGCRRQPVQHPRQRIPIRAKHAPAAQQRHQVRRCQGPQTRSLVQGNETRAGGRVGEVRGVNAPGQIGSARLPEQQRGEQGTFSSPTALHDRDRARGAPQQRHQMTPPRAWARAGQPRKSGWARPTPAGPAERPDTSEHVTEVRATARETRARPQGSHARRPRGAEPRDARRSRC
jgi:hypothetical protein